MNRKKKTKTQKERDKKRFVMTHKFKNTFVSVCDVTFSWQNYLLGKIGSLGNNQMLINIWISIGSTAAFLVAKTLTIPRSSLCILPFLSYCTVRPLDRNQILYFVGLSFFSSSDGIVQSTFCYDRIILISSI